jgi:3-carboxy-cis,cis-muconate cycloisomerase
VRWAEALVRDMQVFPQKMRADLDITHGLIMAEAVTLALAEFHNQPVGNIEVGAHLLREDLHVAHQRLALRQRPAHQG